jgi:hypothetical protein
MTGVDTIMMASPSVDDVAQFRVLIFMYLFREWRSKTRRVGVDKSEVRYCRSADKC